MSGERQRRERCGSKGSWQTVPDAWAGDRKTPRCSNRLFWWSITIDDSPLKTIWFVDNNQQKVQGRQQQVLSLGPTPQWLMGIVSERCYALELILLRLAANCRWPSVGRCYWRRLSSDAVTDTSIRRDSVCSASVDAGEATRKAAHALFSCVN